MASIATNEIKPGAKLIIDGDPYNVINNEGVKPGKGQAFNRIKMKNIKTGRVIEKTFKSGESLERADIQEIEVTFLYSDGDYWFFMDQAYEQHSASGSAIEDAQKWLKEESECMLVLWNGTVISVTPENFVELEVIECEPAVKGDTVSGALKTATVETQAEVKVPLFIEKGDFLKIDTRTGEYVSRVKN